MKLFTKKKQNRYITNRTEKEMRKAMSKAEKTKEKYEKLCKEMEGYCVEYKQLIKEQKILQARYKKEMDEVLKSAGSKEKF